jgi:hypothetical protein
MLQRIQSVYLLFATLVLFALYLFPLTHNIYINGVSSTIKVTGIYQDINGNQNQTTPFTALTMVTGIIAMIPTIIIFMYKDRKKQVVFCYSAILVIIGYSFWLSQTVKNATGGAELRTDNIGIGIFLSSISIVLLILAVKSIQKDEKLVRSADRLR